VIIEFDGPKMSYFEMEDETGGRIHLHYRTLLFKAPSKQMADDFGRMYLRKLREKLESIATERSVGFIIWRVRPTERDDGIWRCRVATSPPLPTEFWRDELPLAAEGAVPVMIQTMPVMP
jgi:hypothetical protein